MSAGASSSDDDFQFEAANVGSNRYPVHDCCEFEDAESLRRLIFVPQDESGDDQSSESGESSVGKNDEDDDESSSSDDNDSHAAAHAAATGQSPPVAPIGATAAAAAGMGGSTVPIAASLDDSNKGESDAAVGAGTNGDTKPLATAESAQDETAAARQENGESESKESAVTKSSLPISPEQEQAFVPMDTTDEAAAPQPPAEAADSLPAPEEEAPPHKKQKKRKREKETSYYCPYDLNDKDEDENTALHVAVHARKLQHVELLLQAGAYPDRRSDGSAPVHTAISVGSISRCADFSLECVKLLVENGADVTIKDESNHTPLALACAMNLPQVVEYILSLPAGKSTLNTRCERLGGRALHIAAKFDVPLPAIPPSSPPPTRSPGGHHHPDGSIVHAGHHLPGMHVDKTQTMSHNHEETSEYKLTVTQLLLGNPDIEVDAVNMMGQTPLHIACSRGNWPVIRALLQAGASHIKEDHRGLTPGQTARKRGMPMPADLLEILGSDSADASRYPPRDLILDPDGSTLLMCHELCILHRTCPPIRRDSPEPPPENVRRLHVLINEHDGILRGGEFGRLVWEGEARRAAMIDVLKVHEYNYVERISELCSSIPDHPNAIAHLDADTALSRWSFEAAMRAAGSVCDAIDKVVSGDFRNAFCAIRPPGHHAGPRGIVRCPNDPEGGSHGFCLLNNVAIGAAYARSMYRNEGIRKIAIVDFDVHHGNGTEEIIRQLIPTMEKTVIRTPFANGEMTAHKYRPWLDESDVNDVFFASTHGFGPRGIEFASIPQQGGWFYPASGKTHTSDAIVNPSLVDTPSVQDFILSQSWTRMGEESKANCCKIINCGLGLPQPNAIPGMQRLELRDTYRKKILPHLRDFDPDIIFISAGFDAHKRDSMNFGYVGMVEEDYEWVTEQLVKIANTCCEGRIVSVLEGGYKIHGGIVSPFARSVASHVRALADGGRSRELYNLEDSNWESQFERHVVEDRERKRQAKVEKLRRMEARARAAAMAESQNHEDALMKAPLNEQLDAAAVGEEEPTRKRRRPNVDYKKLLEEIQQDGGSG